MLAQFSSMGPSWASEIQNFWGNREQFILRETTAVRVCHQVLASTGGESTALAVDALRSSTKAEMKERAERKRQEMLADMGMQQVRPNPHLGRRRTTSHP